VGKNEKMVQTAGANDFLICNPSRWDFDGGRGEAERLSAMSRPWEPATQEAGEGKGRAL